MVLRVTSRDDILKASIGAKGSERRIQMNQKLFYEANHPIVKIHGEIEERMHDQDKRQFGGIYYTNKARKLHVALLENSHYAFEEKIAAQDVELHSDGSIRLVGSASVNSTSSFYCTRIQYMVDAYGLTVMPEGSISV